jgi:hypothetical protein
MTSEVPTPTRAAAWSWAVPPWYSSGRGYGAHAGGRVTKRRGRTILRAMMGMRRLGGLVLVLVLALGCEGMVLPRPELPGEGDASVDAGARADAGPDAGLEPDARVDGGRPRDAAVLGPVLYPADRRHSPLVPELVDGLRAVAVVEPALADDVFMKVGDSITVSRAFLHCFDGTRVDLDGRPLEDTRLRFLAGDAAGTSPYRRESLSAIVGWSASQALAGDPSPLAQEHAALRPRYAVVMFGTNDSGYRPLESFGRDLWTIVDQLRARGTIPLVSTIPPRDDSAEVDARVPLYNLAIRAVAQGRGVPLVDYHRELSPLPDHGLATDGVHPSATSGGCVLDETGLQRGYNVRNLLTLEQLDRATRALGGEALDVEAPRLRGEGSADDPYLVDALPFALMGDTASSSERSIDTYACAPTTREDGPERVHRLELERPARVTAVALSARGVDVDVHVLAGAVAPEACLARDNREVTLELDAGTYYVVVDTWADASGATQPGEYLLLVDVAP